MLLQLHDRFNLESSIEASFWAICLVAFYGMFRKSHLLPMSPTSFDPRKQLTKADFKIFPRGVLTNIRWSNTIQYRRRVEISLPCIPRSPLFPTAAIVNALRFTASGSNRCSQTFNWSDDRQLVHGFSCGSFASFLRNHLASLGFDPKLFAGHSLRRGGASFAYQRGVPIELFKAFGEWHSDTILIYLTMPLTGRLHSAYMLCKAILRHNPLHPHTN